MNHQSARDRGVCRAGRCCSCSCASSDTGDGKRVYTLFSRPSVLFVADGTIVENFKDCVVPFVSLNGIQHRLRQFDPLGNRSASLGFLGRTSRILIVGNRAYRSRRDRAATVPAATRCSLLGGVSRDLFRKQGRNGVDSTGFRVLGSGEDGSGWVSGGAGLV
ncbi:hypothetical protein NPIL_533161 [Nephila pilipes]|uniref:Uncharacterized protein n=1 Tax=Nephila pilipes TaxID=299642 RepID=A0A8X6TS04_NEPPI|nr:hypothetical protein NPIL_533161 [Nephila pilipes]